MHINCSHERAIGSAQSCSDVRCRFHVGAVGSPACDLQPEMNQEAHRLFPSILIVVHNVLNEESRPYYGLLKRWHRLCPVSRNHNWLEILSYQLVCRADEYAAQGCKVYATARKLESMATFQHPSIEKLTLDVLSDEQVTSVVKTIIEKEGQIDVLVNNAGVNCAGTSSQVRLAILAIEYLG